MRKRVAAIVLGVGIVALAIWLWQGARERITGEENAADPVAEQAPSEAVPGLAPRPAPSVDRAAGKDPSDAASATEAGEDGGVPTGPEWREQYLAVKTVDATTGAPVAGRWTLLHSGLNRHRLFREGETREEAARADRESFEESLLPSGASESWRVSGDNSKLPRSPHVRPPSGYVVIHDLAQLDTTVAADARQLVAVVPLHREVVLDVRVLAPDGRPAQGAELVALEVAGHDVSPVTETTGPGEFRVRGIPHLPGEPVVGGLEWGTSPDGGSVELAVEAGIASPEIATTVPADTTSRWSVVVRLEGPVAHLRDHIESDNDLPLVLRAPVAEDGAPRGRVRVKALGWDGGPAGGASVLGHPLDAKGEVLLEDLPVGEMVFQMTAPGRFPATASAFVRANTTADVVLREPTGARLEVVVVDEEGRPRPFAKIRVDRPWFDLVGEQQRLDRFTDANGRRSLARVEAGTATVFANWGTRHGRSTVTLRDGERATVRIVAK